MRRPASPFFISVSMMVLAFGGMTVYGQTWPNRVTGSPYPASPAPADTVYLFEGGGDNGFTILTLQGLLAKRKPRIYYGGGLWLAELRRTPGITVVDRYRNDMPGLVNLFKAEIKGLVLLDRATPSVNAGLSLCGILGALAVTPANADALTALGLPVLQDALGKSEAEILEGYRAQFRPSLLILQAPAKNQYLVDYTVFAGAFRFYSAPDAPIMANAYTSLMKPNGVVFGWGTDEFQTVMAASRHGAALHPADYCQNLSTLSNMPVPPLKQRTRVTPPPARNVHTVCFLMSDGDNLQWQLGGFANDGKYLGNANRGQVNLGWTASPALAELAPMALAHFYQKAANQPEGKDEFVAGPSGLGYFFPDRSPDLEAAGALLNRFMQKADMRIVNIIADREPSAAQYQAYLQHTGIDAIFYYPFANHYIKTVGATEIRWIAGKPIISGRRALWSGVETPASLAAKVNALPRDPKSVNGYSLIPVHVWSYGVDDVLACARALDSQGVEVVTPDAFVQRLRANFGASSALLPGRQAGGRKSRGNPIAGLPRWKSTSTEAAYSADGRDLTASP